MLRIIRIGLGAIALLLLVITPALAQELAVRWSAYLFNGQLGELVRVWQDGAQASYSLGLEANTYVSGYDMAFTADGEKAAYCVVKFPENAAALGSTTLIVRDIAAQTNLLQVDLGKAIGCRTGHHAFSSDGSRVAVGKVNYYPGAPGVDASTPIWQLLVVDTASGSTLQELNGQSPAAITAAVTNDAPLLPYIQWVADDVVVFVAVPYGIGGGGVFPAYQWQQGSGSVSPINHWSSIGLDTLSSTGEVIWVASDPTRPVGNPGGPMDANNVLKLVHIDPQERVIYTSPDWLLTDARFINGGQQIAIQEISSFDADHPETPQTIKWIILDRAGNTADLQIVGLYSDLVAAPMGYAIMDVQYRGENQTLPKFTFDYHSVNGTMTLWSYEAQDMSASWEVVWSARTESARDLQPFPAVA